MTVRFFYAAAILAAAILPASAQQQPWKLATMLPLTGSNAGAALEYKVGFELAVEEINRNGGIKGRPVALEILDTQSNPGQVATLIRKACDEALIVVGPSNSAESQVGFPVANTMKCPSFAPAAGASGLAEKNRPWSFSMMTPADISTPLAMNDFIKKIAPKVSVTFIERQELAAVSYGQPASDTLKKNGVKDEVIPVSGNDVDFSPSVTRAASSDPDLIVISSMERASIGLLKELHKAQTKSKIMLTMSSYNSAVGAIGNDVMEGVYRYALSDPESSSDPKVQKFVAEGRARTNRTPSLSGTLCYDALMVTAHVIDKANLKGDPASRDEDRQKFIDTMMQVKDWDGLGGRFSMSPQGFMQSRPIVLVFKSGKWEVVKD